MTLIILPQAEIDLQNSYDWYNRQELGLGEEFMSSIGDTIRGILEFPEAHAAGYRRTRKVGVHRFPYLIYYRFQENNVEIFAVMHASRSGKEWKSRT